MPSPSSLESLITQIQLQAIIHCIPSTIADDLTLLNFLRNHQQISQDKYYTSLLSIIKFNSPTDEFAELLCHFSMFVTTLCNEYFCESFLAQLEV